MEAARLSEVIIHDDENFERALKRFKKKCEKAGILSDLTQAPALRETERAPQAQDERGDAQKPPEPARLECRH